MNKELFIDVIDLFLLPAFIVTVLTITPDFQNDVQFLLFIGFLFVQNIVLSLKYPSKQQDLSISGKGLFHAAMAIPLFILLSVALLIIFYFTDIFFEYFLEEFLFGVDPITFIIILYIPFWLYSAHNVFKKYTKN